MPFTISHIAAALPFSRLLARQRILSAAVIGSMAPDLHYLLPVPLPRFESHSFAALWTFSLPVGLLAYWLFQKVMKAPLLAVLPQGAYRRWVRHAEPASLLSLRQWLMAAAAVLAGAVLHLAWDGFTHEDGRGVRMLPELSDPMFELHGHLWTGARMLQDLSSLIGLLLVLIAIGYALRPGETAPALPRPLNAVQRRCWVAVYLIGTIGLFVGLLMRGHAGGWVHPAAIALLRAMLLAPLIVSLMLSIYLTLKRER